MKTAPFTVTFPSANLQPAVVDVPTAGTPLAGITAGMPTLVNHVNDDPVAIVGGSGDAIVTGRVSAPDTVRLRAKGIGTGPVEVIITVFD